jgi:hypothetical protein
MFLERSVPRRTGEAMNDGDGAKGYEVGRNGGFLGRYNDASALVTLQADERCEVIIEHLGTGSVEHILRSILVPNLLRVC